MEHTDWIRAKRDWIDYLSHKHQDCSETFDPANPDFVFCVAHSKLSPLLKSTAFDTPLRECKLCTVSGAAIWDAVHLSVLKRGVEEARAFWVTAREKALLVSETREQPNDRQRAFELHKKAVDETINWMLYEQACWREFAPLRSALMHNTDAPNLITKHQRELMQQKVHDSALRNPTMRKTNAPRCTTDQTMCPVHQGEIGDAWPWRADTRAYNPECVCCVLPKQPSASARKRAQVNSTLAKWQERPAAASSRASSAMQD